MAVNNKFDPSIYMGNPNLPSSKAEFDFTPEMIKEMAKCKKNITHFAENHFYITTLEEGKQKITLYRPQRRIIKSLGNHNRVCCLASRQTGKALALDTPVPTPNGWTTMGNLKDGDIVLDNYGNPTKVIKAWDIMENRPCYKITFDNGESIVADEGHLWLTEDFNDRRRLKRNPDSKKKNKKRTTKELYETLFYKNGATLQSNHSIRSTNPVRFSSIQELEIDPYIFGLWLGDGNSYNPKITIGLEDIDSIISNLNKLNYLEGVNFNIYPEKDGTISLSFIGKTINSHKTMRKLIREYGVYGNKHIPEKYLRSTINDRKKLLQGLMDSDGSISNTNCTFYNSNKILIDNFSELLNGLGVKHNLKEKKYKNSHNGIIGKPMYRIHFKCDFDAFMLERKLEKQNYSSKRENDHYIINIERVDSVPVRCITVDSEDAMFLCGKSFIPTSNTTLMTIYALWLTCFETDKTVLIVANKEATAINILRRIRMAYEYLPNWLKPGVKQWGKTEVVFANDSRITISSTSSSSSRGETANCVDGESIVTIRDKNTQEVMDISMKDLASILKGNGTIIGLNIIDEEE